MIQNHYRDIWWNRKLAFYYFIRQFSLFKESRLISHMNFLPFSYFFFETKNIHMWSNLMSNSFMRSGKDILITFQQKFQQQKKINIILLFCKMPTSILLILKNLFYRLLAVSHWVKQSSTTSSSWACTYLQSTHVEEKLMEWRGGKRRRTTFRNSFCQIHKISNSIISYINNHIHIMCDIFWRNVKTWKNMNMWIHVFISKTCT